MDEKKRNNLYEKFYALTLKIAKLNTTLRETQIELQKTSNELEDAKSNKNNTKP